MIDLYGVEIDTFNYAGVFGVAFGMYIISNLSVVATEAVTFVKGWRSN